MNNFSDIDLLNLEKEMNLVEETPEEILDRWMLLNGINTVTEDTKNALISIIQYKKDNPDTPIEGIISELADTQWPITPWIT